MKAVIMAGGEGTRLRPLTSNQPKPMLPMANRPMMEHIVLLLRQHGFDDIVVTVAFMANAIRTYFGDGSELGVRMVYATEETPLGTAGSVLNARDELDERFLVISGDVLTDIDLGAVVDFHEREGRAGHAGPELGREPARVRHRDHRRGRVDRAVPREADLGPGLLRHDQHRHLRARARGLRLHPPRAAGRLLRRGLPGRARGRAADLRLRGRRLLGGRRHHRGLPQGPPGHPRRAGPGRDRRVPAARPGCGWARARPSTPARWSTARRSSGSTARSAPARCSGEYTTLGLQRPGRRRRRDPAVGRQRQRLPRGRGPGRGRGHRPVVRPAAGRRTASRGRCSARGA